MPIQDSTLAKPKNRFVAVSGEAVVGQAIAALQAEGGDTSWYLLVRRSDAHWGITTFADLCTVLAGKIGAEDVRLEGWEGLVRATVIEQDAMGDDEAELQGSRSPGQSLVVISQGQLKGIVSGRKRSFVKGVLPASQLNALGGKYVRLKDYSSILLWSTKKAKP